MLNSTRVFISNYRNQIIILLLIGLGLRIVQYIADRSMWYDEAAIVDNIIDRPISDFLKPLDYDQGAPLGFMIVVKVFSQIFGTGEHGLRLVPFISGIISLFLFYYLAKRYIPKNSVPIAIALFAISDTLVYYSSEVKQYSSDVTIAIALLLIGISLVNTPKLAWKDCILSGLAGAALLWFSHPAVFSTVSILVVLAASRIRSRQLSEWVKIAVLGAFWGVSFILLYIVQLKSLGQNPYLEGYWAVAKAFMPLPPRSVEDAQWFLSMPGRVFSDIPLRFYGAAELAVFLFVLSVVFLLLKDRKKLFLLTLPILLALGASGVHKYPFGDRLLLFIVPMVILLVAQGASLVYEASKYRFVGVVCIAMLFFFPGFYALAHFVTTPYSVTQIQSIKPLLNYMAANKQPDDIIFINYVTQPAFYYYAERYRLQKERVIAAPDTYASSSAYESKLPQLVGHKRVWILISAFREMGEFNEQFKPFLAHLDTIGHKVEEVRETGAILYLYDLSEK
jgi:uncharacterized membrane protein